MISVKEALELSLSDKLNKEEQAIYDKIIYHIDNQIKNNFNGVKVDLLIDGAYINGDTFYFSSSISKAWRREVIMNKWKSGYQSLGWKIEEFTNPNSYKKYTFSVDPSYNRNEKLEKILTNVE